MNFSWYSLVVISERMKRMTVQYWLRRDVLHYWTLYRHFNRGMILSNVSLYLLVVYCPVSINFLFSFIFMPQNSGLLGLHNSVVGGWLLNNALNPQGLSTSLNYPFCPDSGHFERDTQPVSQEGFSALPPPLRRRNTQCVLSHPAAHCLDHNLFP